MITMEVSVDVLGGNGFVVTVMLVPAPLLLRTTVDGKDDVDDADRNGRHVDGKPTNGVHVLDYFCKCGSEEEGFAKS